MSLRAFHIVFVTVSTLLFAFLALWGLKFAEKPDAVIHVLGWAGVIGCLVMPVYGVCFYRKAKTL